MFWTVFWACFWANVAIGALAFVVTVVGGIWRMRVKIRAMIEKPEEIPVDQDAAPPEIHPWRAMLIDCHTGKVIEPGEKIPRPVSLRLTKSPFGRSPMIPVGVPIPGPEETLASNYAAGWYRVLRVYDRFFTARADIEMFTRDHEWRPAGEDEDEVLAEHYAHHGRERPGSKTAHYIIKRQLLSVVFFHPAFKRWRVAMVPS